MTSMSLALLFWTAAAATGENSVIGTYRSDRLLDTPAIDYFIGGTGADTFVIRHLGDEPDHILDFDAREGDSVEFVLEDHRFNPLEQEDFSISRKGVITVKVGGRDQGIVQLDESNLDLKLDVRKGRYHLRFSKKF